VRKFSKRCIGYVFIGGGLPYHEGHYRLSYQDMELPNQMLSSVFHTFLQKKRELGDEL